MRAQELAGHGERQEDVGELVHVRRARGGLGVVLGEAQRPRRGIEEGVEPRGGRGRGEARVGLDQLRLPVEQPELREDVGVGHRRLVRAAEGGHQQRDLVADPAVLVRREEARAQHAAERPLAEEHPPAAVLLVHPLRAVGRQRRIVEQPVPGVDRPAANVVAQPPRSCPSSAEAGGAACCPGCACTSTGGSRSAAGDSSTYVPGPVGWMGADRAPDVISWICWFSAAVGPPDVVAASSCLAAERPPDPLPSCPSSDVAPAAAAPPSVRPPELPTWPVSDAKAAASDRPPFPLPSPPSSAPPTPPPPAAGAARPPLPLPCGPSSADDAVEAGAAASDRPPFPLPS